MRKLHLFLFTIYYMKIIQIVNRIYRKYKKITYLECPNELKILDNNQYIKLEALDNAIIDSQNVTFLNETGKILDWDNKTKPLLWLYNLHYFDYLNARGCSEKHQLNQKIISHWVEHNKFNTGVGWEPYPLSLRIVNWIKFHWSEEALPEKAIESLWSQSNVLSQKLEYHLLGNHLFANAKALIFAGSFFNCKESQKWLATGLKIVTAELNEQVLSDGANFELSPMYHNIILTDMLDLVNLANSTNKEDLMSKVDGWQSIITKMLHWGQSMSHPDGKVSFFNDSAFGIAPDIKVLHKYSKALALTTKELKNTTVPTKGIDHFTFHKNSGYAVVSNSTFKAILDMARVGPDYLPGHAHADTLSFEISHGSQRLFVNSGTSLYGVTDERLRQRKTVSHNTLSIDGLDSSEVWSGFRVARRAYPTVKKVEINESYLQIVCSHNGFKRLKGNPIHQRSWKFNQSSVEVKDEVLGPHRSCQSHFHLHPDIKVERISKSEVHLILPNHEKVVFSSIGEVEILNTTWHPEFGISIPNVKLVCTLINNQNTVFVRF